MPDDGLDQLRPFDAIFLGAVGYPGRSRPYFAVGTADSDPARFRAIRESASGAPACRESKRRSRMCSRGKSISASFAKTMKASTPTWAAEFSAAPTTRWPCSRSIFTRRGVDRILRYAFELARTRKSHVTSATKSNGIIHTMPFWDERFHAIAQEFPDVRTDQYHIDILTAHFVRHPDWFDVVVGSNLFGDILSDLGPAVAGSIGIAPSANMNPERKYPSMFEPVHGSAPDIAGKGIANPIGQIWSGAMMLRHFGEAASAGCSRARD